MIASIAQYFPQALAIIGGASVFFLCICALIATMNPPKPPQS